MDTIGLDLHKRESQLCIGQGDGRIIELRIATTRERFAAVLGNRPGAKILIERVSRVRGLLVTSNLLVMR